MLFQKGQKPTNKVRPEKGVVERLYCEQGLTTYQIGKQFNVSSTAVGNWLKHYDIPRRPSGNGLCTRGQKPPTKKQLNRMIHEQKMTYLEVAKRYDVDLTAVYYWRKKYDLLGPQKLTFAEQYADPDSKQAICSLYEAGTPLQQIAEKYDVTRGVISTYLRGIGVEIRRDGWGGDKRFECKDGHLVRSSYELRVDDWLNQHGIEHVYEPQLPFAPTYCADFLANGWYIEVWGVNDNPDYKQRKALKQELYTRHSIPLIELPSHAFSAFHKGLWKRRLQQCISTPKESV